MSLSKKIHIKDSKVQSNETKSQSSQVETELDKCVSASHTVISFFKTCQKYLSPLFFSLQVKNKCKCIPNILVYEHLKKCKEVINNCELCVRHVCFVIAIF